MTARKITHGTFTLERTFDAPPARVFQAFADQATKARWFQGPPGWKSDRQQFDFRVGGWERVVTGAPGAAGHVFNCLYQDIIPNERIVYTYDMLIGEQRISVSVATLELKSEGKGTRLALTEMGAFLDDFDDPGQRERGTHGLMDQLAAALKLEA